MPIGYAPDVPVEVRHPDPHLLTAAALALCGLVDGSLDHRERDIA